MLETINVWLSEDMETGLMINVLTVTENKGNSVLAEYKGRVLRESRFSESYVPARANHIVSSVAMPYLGGASREVWVTDSPVTYGRESERLEIAQTNGEVLVRVEMATQGGKLLQEAAYEAYEAVFAQAKARNMGLLRVWHYIPEILEWVDGLDNYRWHNIGREQAWRKFGPWQGREPIVPAATGIGVSDGPYVLEALLTPHSVVPLQNPRQTPFVKYGKQYGPKPPFCARGALHMAPWGPEVWISGTASIRKQTSWWRWNPKEQVRETFRNIRALTSDANLALHGVSGMSLEGLTGCRAYIKRQQNQEVIARELDAIIPGISRVEVLTDVCRPELEFEFEGIVR